MYGNTKDPNSQAILRKENKAGSIMHQFQTIFREKDTFMGNLKNKTKQKQINRQREQIDGCQRDGCQIDGQKKAEGD